MAIKLDFTFDNDTYRHYMNGHPSVFHCHHYMCLTVKLAEEMNHIGGPNILIESTEDSIRPLLDDYYKQNGVNDSEDRLRIAEEYYAAMGMGRITAKGTSDGGEITVTNSHVDEGWKKKWGKADKPVNHFGRGFVAAMFGAAFNKAARSYTVYEEMSIAMGAPEGKLIVKLA